MRKPYRGHVDYPMIKKMGINPKKSKGGKIGI